MNILCYGDSNTYGLTPDWRRRFPRNVRWPGRLQEILGASHYVVEDGLNGRCCTIRDTQRYGRAAIDFLPVALECHNPLDYLVLMIGTNDCKPTKARTIRELAAGMEELAKLALRMLPSSAKLLIVAPAPLRAVVLEKDPDFDSLSVQLSQQSADAYREIAERLGCLFLDAGSVTHTSDSDGEHLDEAGHAALALAVAKIIMENPVTCAPADWSPF